MSREGGGENVCEGEGGEKTCERERDSVCRGDRRRIEGRERGLEHSVFGETWRPWQRQGGPHCQNRPNPAATATKVNKMHLYNVHIDKCVVKTHCMAAHSSRSIDYKRGAGQSRYDHVSFVFAASRIIIIYMTSFRFHIRPTPRARARTTSSAIRSGPRPAPRRSQTRTRVPAAQGEDYNYDL